MKEAKEKLSLIPQSLSSVFLLYLFYWGAFAATLGSFFLAYKWIINIVLGLAVILLGLNYLRLLKISFLNKIYKLENKESKRRDYNFLSAFFFGTIFSLGLGIPFIISGLIIDSLKGSFDFIKRNYETINKISDILLVVLGILMLTGLLYRLVLVFS